MAIKDACIGELKHESSLTKKMLERVPLDKKEWVPHEKSMSLGSLATHVAEITHWVSDIIHIDDFDFMKNFNFSHLVSVSPWPILSAISFIFLFLSHVNIINGKLICLPFLIYF